MKSVAIFSSLLSLAAAAVIDRRDEECSDASSIITSTVTAPAAAATAAAITSADAIGTDVCTDIEITSTVTVTSARTPAPTSAGSCTVIVTTVPATDAASISASLVSSAAAIVSTPAPTAAAAAGTNVQHFNGTLGGLPPPVYYNPGERPYSCNNNTFMSANDALGRSCDIQHNACGDAANSGKLSGGVGQCDTQNNECHSFIDLNLRKRHVFRNAGFPHARFHGASFPNATTTGAAPASGTVGSVVMTITSCA